MNNIKKFYKNNRIYCILMGVSIFCLALIAVLGIVYFVNQTKNDKYGDRLNGIESVQITDDHINENNTEQNRSNIEDRAISVFYDLIILFPVQRTVLLIQGILPLIPPSHNRFFDFFSDTYKFPKMVNTNIKS